jgi:hypothetical protein
MGPPGRSVLSNYPEIPPVGISGRFSPPAPQLILVMGTLIYDVL